MFWRLFLIFLVVCQAIKCQINSSEFSKSEQDSEEIYSKESKENNKTRKEDLLNDFPSNKSLDEFHDEYTDRSYYQNIPTTSFNKEDNEINIDKTDNSFSAENLDSEEENDCDEELNAEDNRDNFSNEKIQSTQLLSKNTDDMYEKVERRLKPNFYVNTETNKGIDDDLINNPDFEDEKADSVASLSLFTNRKALHPDITKDDKYSDGVTVKNFSDLFSSNVDLLHEVIENSPGTSLRKSNDFEVSTRSKTPTKYTQPISELSSDVSGINGIKYVSIHRTNDTMIVEKGSSSPNTIKTFDDNKKENNLTSRVGDSLEQAVDALKSSEGMQKVVTIHKQLTLRETINKEEQNRVNIHKKPQYQTLKVENRAFADKSEVQSRGANEGETIVLIEGSHIPGKNYGPEDDTFGYYASSYTDDNATKPLTNSYQKIVKEVNHEEKTTKSILPGYNDHGNGFSRQYFFSTPIRTTKSSKLLQSSNHIHKSSSKIAPDSYNPRHLKSEKNNDIASSESFDSTEQSSEDDSKDTQPLGRSAYGEHDDKQLIPITEADPKKLYIDPTTGKLIKVVYEDGDSESHQLSHQEDKNPNGKYPIQIENKHASLNDSPVKLVQPISSDHLSQDYESNENLKAGYKVTDHDVVSKEDISSRYTADTLNENNDSYKPASEHHLSQYDEELHPVVTSSVDDHHNSHENIYPHITERDKPKYILLCEKLHHHVQDQELNEHYPKLSENEEGYHHYQKEKEHYPKINHNQNHVNYEEHYHPVYNDDEKRYHQIQNQQIHNHKEHNPTVITNGYHPIQNNKNYHPIQNEKSYPIQIEIIEEFPQVQNQKGHNFVQTSNTKSKGYHPIHLQNVKEIHTVQNQKGYSPIPIHNENNFHIIQNQKEYHPVQIHNQKGFPPVQIQNEKGFPQIQSQKEFHSIQNEKGYHPIQNEKGYHSIQNEKGYHPIHNEKDYNPIQNKKGYNPIQHENGYHPIQNEKGYHHIQNEKGYHPIQNEKGYYPIQNEKGYHPIQNEKGYHPIQNQEEIHSTQIHDEDNYSEEKQYPLQNDKGLENINSHEVFSSVENHKGYHPIHIQNEHHHKINVDSPGHLVTHGVLQQDFSAIKSHNDFKGVEFDSLREHKEIKGNDFHTKNIHSEGINTKVPQNNPHFKGDHFESHSNQGLNNKPHGNLDLFHETQNYGEGEVKGEHLNIMDEIPKLVTIHKLKTPMSFIPEPHSQGINFPKQNNQNYKFLLLLKPQSNLKGTQYRPLEKESNREKIRKNEHYKISLQKMFGFNSDEYIPMTKKYYSKQKHSNFGSLSDIKGSNLEDKLPNNNLLSSNFKTYPKGPGDTSFENPGKTYLNSNNYGEHSKGNSFNSPPHEQHNYNHFSSDVHNNLKGTEVSTLERPHNYDSRHKLQNSHYARNAGGFNDRSSIKDSKIIHLSSYLENLLHTKSRINEHTNQKPEQYILIEIDDNHRGQINSNEEHHHHIPLSNNHNNKHNYASQIIGRRSYTPNDSNVRYMFNGGRNRIFPIRQLATTGIHMARSVLPYLQTPKRRSIRGNISFGVQIEKDPSFAIPEYRMDTNIDQLHNSTHS